MILINPKYITAPGKMSGGIIIPESEKDREIATNVVTTVEADLLSKEHPTLSQRNQILLADEADLQSKRHPTLSPRSQTLLVDEADLLSKKLLSLSHENQTLRGHEVQVKIVRKVKPKANKRLLHRPKKRPRHQQQSVNADPVQHHRLESIGTSQVVVLTAQRRSETAIETVASRETLIANAMVIQGGSPKVIVGIEIAVATGRVIVTRPATK